MVDSLRGPKGAKGDPGPQGPRGNQGPKGDPGDEGTQGIRGIQGPQGDRGPHGTTGDTGIPGGRGSQGDQGIQGLQGVRGLQGLQGIQGNNGAKGDRGPQGDAGLTGPRGFKGTPGDSGAKGDKGDAGASTDLATIDTRVREVAQLDRNDTSQPNPLGFLSFQGTDPEHVVDIKPLGDGRNGVWELVHDDTSGYIFHLMTGQNMGDGQALIGMGIDNGGTGLFVNNKHTGVGIKIDQNETITSQYAHAFQLTQKSALASAIYIEQLPDTAPSLQMWALGENTSDDYNLAQWLYGSVAHTAGAIKAKTGILQWNSDILALGSKFRARMDNGGSDLTVNHITMDQDGWEIDANSGSGVADNGWWVGRILRDGWSMKFQAAQGFSDRGGVGTTMNTLITLGYGGKLGFFGSDGTDVAPSVPEDATDTASTQLLVNSLRSALINLGLVT